MICRSCTEEAGSASAEGKDVTMFPKTAYSGRPLTPEEKTQAELYKSMMYSLLNGRQGYGKNYAAATKLRQEAAQERGASIQDQLVCHALDSGKMMVGYIKGKSRATLPQKVCNYRKPKVYWFGELHPSNNLIYNPGFIGPIYWTIDPDKLILKGRDPKDGLSVFPSVPLGTTTGRFADADPLKGKRFVGISEPTETDKLDQDFLMRLTGDEIPTRTLSTEGKPWVPQGKIFIGGSKLPKINDKSKETIERVKQINYP